MFRAANAREAIATLYHASFCTPVFARETPDSFLGPGLEVIVIFLTLSLEKHQKLIRIRLLTHDLLPCPSDRVKYAIVEDEIHRW